MTDDERDLLHATEADRDGDEDREERPRVRVRETDERQLRLPWR